MPTKQNDQSPSQPVNATNPNARHNARQYAVQAMYQWQLSGTDMKEIEAEFIRLHIEKKLDLLYFKELIHQIPAIQKEIDTQMQPFLARSIQEINPIELAVLRIAIYELLKRPDVPYRVIINEALELTKKFGSPEGHKFVNGLLDKVAKKNRATEINMGKKK